MADQVAPSAGRVLLVDDEPAVLAALGRHLRRKGFAVTACASGREALQAFAPGRFDLLLTDMRMPPPDGLELLRLVRRQEATIPALVLTGYGTTENAIAAFREGRVSNYLLKPLEDINHLSEAAAQAIEEGRRRTRAAAAAARLLLLSRVADWSEDAILFCRGDGTIAAVNQQASRLLQAPGERLEGRPLPTLAPRRSRSRRELCALLEHAQEGRQAESEITLVSAQGEAARFTVSALPLPGEGGPNHVIAFTCAKSREPVGPESDPLTSLTPRERQVAELVAAGLGNRAIAARLFVSEVTVKTHLTAILRKLGLRSRLELAVGLLAAGEQPDPPRRHDRVTG